VKEDEKEVEKLGRGKVGRYEYEMFGK